MVTDAYILQLKEKLEKIENDQQFRKILKQATAQVLVTNIDKNICRQILEIIQNNTTQEDLTLYIKDSLLTI